MDAVVMDSADRNVCGDGVGGEHDKNILDESIRVKSLFNMTFPLLFSLSFNSSSE
jgi:hypothetical protein